MSKTLLFELLQVTYGNRQELSCVPSAAEWEDLFLTAKKQALAGVAFVGVRKILSDSPLMGENLSDSLQMQWMGVTAKVNQRNRVANEACDRICKQLVHDGFHCCVLKGQGNIDNYRSEIVDSLGMYRTPGDIDVWCKPAEAAGIPIAEGDDKEAHYEYYSGKRGVIEYTLMLHRLAGSTPRGGVRYHHIGSSAINGVEIELHYRPLYLNSPMRNRRLQRWFRDNEQFGMHDAKIGDCVIPTPTVSFNAVYQLAHIYRHLFDEGVGLRQLLDYYFVLRALHIEQESFADRTQSMAQWAEGMGVAVKSNEEIMHTLSRFGMKKFAGAVMYVLQTVFAMPDEYLICKPNEEEGKFLLNEIMMAGNFGKYDDRIKRPSKSPLKGDFFSPQIRHAIEKTKHNLRLLTHYPEEVLWEPFFRMYHWIWRRFELWRY